MAEANISMIQDQFSCSICLDLLKDPVTIPCGHSYCMSCITRCWNQQDHSAVYSCPLCKRTFTPRPVLYKNVVFAEMVENLKKTRLQTPNYTGPGDVECDVCTGRKRKAVKSCLMCLESYCQTHFERHEELHSGRRHKVTDATGRLQEMICSKHNKQLEIFCRTDQQCICYLCTMDEHKNHDTVAAVVERTEKQRALEDRQAKFQELTLKREKNLQMLKESVKTYKLSAQEAVENIEMIFTELIRSIERSRSEVTQMIRDQEKAEVSRAEGHLKQLEQEIDNLRRRDAKLKKLLDMDDHIQFLQSCQSLDLHDPSGNFLIPRSPLYFNNVEESVSKLKVQLEALCKEEVDKILKSSKETEQWKMWEEGPIFFGYDAIKNLEEASKVACQHQTSLFAGLFPERELFSTSHEYFDYRLPEDFELPDLPGDLFLLPSSEKDTETHQKS